MLEDKVELNYKNWRSYKIFDLQYVPSCMYETIIQDICFSFRRSFEKRAFTLQDENGAISGELLKLICDRFNQKRNQLCNVLCFTAL